MKFFILFLLAHFVVFNLAKAADDSCVNRRVMIELETNQISHLKSFFSAQSDLPYTFKEKAGAQGIDILEISYRRKTGKDDFPEPLSHDLFKKVVERLFKQIEKYKIKKISAEFIPGQCL